MRATKSHPRHDIAPTKMLAAALLGLAISRFEALAPDRLRAPDEVEETNVDLDKTDVSTFVKPLLLFLTVGRLALAR